MTENCFFVKGDKYRCVRKGTPMAEKINGITRTTAGAGGKFSAFFQVGLLEIIKKYAKMPYYLRIPSGMYRMY